VCEGEQTEKHYFQSFKSDKLHLDVRPHVGQPRQIVLRAEVLTARRAYDEVWVVFDLDHYATRGDEQYQDFTNAVKLAKSKKTEVAYTIDAFELWFRLHYEPGQTHQPISVPFRAFAPLYPRNDHSEHLH
jgi:hypothetical protein